MWSTLLLAALFLVPVPGDGMSRSGPIEFVDAPARSERHSGPERQSRERPQVEVEFGPIDITHVPSDRHREVPDRSPSKTNRPQSRKTKPQTFEPILVLHPEIVARQKFIHSVVERVNKSRGWLTSVTSSFRTNSQAHLRGGLDFRALGSLVELKERAAVYSAALGPQFTVILEWVDAQAGLQTDFAYAGGIAGNTKEHPWPGRADATHIHIQPNAPLSVDSAASRERPLSEQSPRPKKASSHHSCCKVDRHGRGE